MERRECVVTNSALKPGVLRNALRLLREKRWSPEQISGSLKLEGIHISTERIYQEIRRNPELHQYCHHKMKYRHYQKKPRKTASRALIQIFREYYPKGSDFREIQQLEMNKVQYQINEQPRKN